MGLWHGDLRSSPGDIAFDCVLLVAIAAAYIPQLVRITTKNSTQGISPLFILFGALFSNAQLANALLLTARAWPTDGAPALELIGNGQLRGREAFGAILGLVQIALQWACSIAFLLLFATYPSDTPSSCIWSGRSSVPAIVFAHAALFVFPAVVIGLSKPSPSDMGIDMFIGFTALLNNFLTPLFVIVQFLAQQLEMHRGTGTPGSLSLYTLAAQTLLSIFLAVRWLQRLGRRPEWDGVMVPSLSEKWQWGLVPFSYIVYAIGAMVLLGLYLKNLHWRMASGNRWPESGENQPLLS